MGSTEDVMKLDFKTRYIGSMYWSIVTMCTLGYGDVVPKTSGISI